jgi:hypothetical protein
MDAIKNKSMPEPNSGCWLWLQCTNFRGYGLIRRDGRTRTAHRVAFEIVYGSIPKGMLVCHKCDTPGCVNPDHLFLGTSKDNTADMLRKGRMATGVRQGAYTKPEMRRRGEQHGCAKLTADQVRAIRLDPRPQRVIAADYGMKQPQISSIKRREAWGHI